MSSIIWFAISQPSALTSAQSPETVTDTVKLANPTVNEAETVTEHCKTSISEIVNSRLLSISAETSHWDRLVISPRSILIFMTGEFVFCCWSTGLGYTLANPLAETRNKAIKSRIILFIVLKIDLFFAVYSRNVFASGASCKHIRRARFEWVCHNFLAASVSPSWWFLRDFAGWSFRCGLPNKFIHSHTRWFSDDLGKGKVKDSMGNKMKLVKFHCRQCRYWYYKLPRFFQ